ncbi:MAG: hypothetical protein Q9209_002148 [Squamulea sp. 1 TL-2023]
MTTEDSITRSPPLPLVSLVTVISLLFSFSILAAAILLSQHLLPRSAPRQHLYLHTWHLFDFLIHTVFEGSFLYHSFFTYTALPPASSSGDYPHPASINTASETAFLGYSNRRYGAAHSTSPTALLWQEYARADARWANTDTNIISIELLTVFIAGPLALYICYLLQRQPQPSRSELFNTTTPSYTGEKTSSSSAAQLWFLIIILATGEIYGGFMTFAPEWMSGNTNLRTANWMYLWLYLLFFNGIWVVMPGWCLWVAWGEVKRAFGKRTEAVGVDVKKTR